MLSLQLNRRGQKADRRKSPVRDRRTRETGDRRRGIDRRWPWMRSVGLAVAMWLGLRVFVVQAFDIPSGSMEGSLMTGDVVFVTKGMFGAAIPGTNRHLPAVREPRLGEILVFHSVEGRWDMVKRMVGEAGDTLEMVDGHLLRNGDAVNEPYAVHTNIRRHAAARERAEMLRWQLPHYIGIDPRKYDPDVQNWGPIVVPQGQYFMLGDNRDDSRDSRYWGFVPRENIIGTPLIVSFSYDQNAKSSWPLLTAIRWDRLLTRPQ